MERREFAKICAAACALGGREALAAGNLSARFYGRVQLADERGAPLQASHLVAGRNYIFHYPFEATPSFLLNLGRPTGRAVELKTEDGSIYQWPGGVGPNRSIVAFSAICAHRMTYPTPQISFISYRERSSSPANPRPNVIHCCSEHSEYDPASGARVVGGPAPQPLAAVLLEHDRTTDRLHALGTLGHEMFSEFFAKYEFKLAMDYGQNMRRQVTGRTVVRDLDSFCKQQVRC